MALTSLWDIRMRILSWSGVLLGLGLLLMGCYPKGDSSAPIPSLLQSSTLAEADTLVVVLPGRADDVDALRRSDIANAVQSAWPGADVQLTGLALGYYMAGNATQRLHEEIMVPARAHGYRHVWLLGASLGGMGALLYDRAYPEGADGLVLMAPYLGEKQLLQEIERAGGAGGWQPGPVPDALDADNFQHELWRYLKTWASDPTRAKTVWLAYGDRDRLRTAMPLLTPLLPSGHVFVRDGGHAWSTWTPAAVDILAGINPDGTRRTK